MLSHDRIVRIAALEDEGYVAAEIARKADCDPRTVRRYLRDPTLLGKPVTRRKRTSILDPYRAQLEELAEGGDRASTVFRLLRKAGYAGGRTLVKNAVQDLKGSRKQLADPD